MSGSDTVTIFCETRDLGSGILASALVATDLGTIRLYGAAWRADGGDGEPWIPSEMRIVGCTVSLTHDAFEAHAAASRWFDDVRAEVWRRSHPSSTPVLPDAS